MPLFGIAVAEEDGAGERALRWQASAFEELGQAAATEGQRRRGREPDLHVQRVKEGSNFASTLRMDLLDNAVQPWLAPLALAPSAAEALHL